MKHKVLVVDLDGTTLDARGQLGERDVAAAQALRRAGVHVTIATGRLFTGTQWVARALGVQGSVALMNGSELVDAQSALVTHGRYIEAPARAHARRVLSELGLPAFLFGSRRIHLDARHAAHAAYLGTWTPDLTHHDDIFGADEWHLAQDILALGAVGEPDAVTAARDALHADLPSELDTVVFRTWEGDTFLKLRHAVEDKGTAAERLAAEVEATLDETVVVGDWLNDLPMLERAGLSFAMGGSSDEVLAAADEELEAPRGGGGAIAEIAWKVWGVR